MSSPEEFAGSLRVVASLFERAREHLATGQEPAESAAERLRASLDGSSQPAAQTAVELSAEATERVEAAIRSLAHSAAELSDYMAQVLDFGVGPAQPQLAPVRPTGKKAGPRSGDAAQRPGDVRGPLRDSFRSGVHDDDEGRFSDEERAVADWLAARYPGCAVHPRHRDPAKRERSPDAMVRIDSQDAGTVTEFKTLKRPSATAVKDNIRDAIHQVLPHGNGHVVVDGRSVGLSETDARRGYARLVGERRKHGRPMARQVTIILGDSTDISWRSDV